jgi:hypothetical protein
VDCPGQELSGLGDEAGEGVQADAGVAEPVGGALTGEAVDRFAEDLEAVLAGAVPLENRIRPVTCRSSGRQAACVYSVIRPPRTGFRRICCLSTLITVMRAASEPVDKGQQARRLQA